ncbi:MAG: DUF4215 domain-containing protein [Deltaproteobacteria bacterium]|nr:DUF4215 domain-containing protein [Deltaproteobacteria bacterium]
MDPGEQCDDGNSNNMDECRHWCLLPYCGDGIPDPGEECDDGNDVDWDGCTACMLPVCGDGIPEPPELCDQGDLNEDRPALELSQGSLTVALTPMDRSQSAVAFYQYYSASAHTGYEKVDTSRMYFHRDTNNGVLSLIMHHGIDFQSGNPYQETSTVDFTIDGLPAVVQAALSDDPGNEFRKVSPTMAVGDWWFQANTDGGILEGFPLPGSWAITIDAVFGGAMKYWQFVDGDNTLISLAVGQTLTLRAYDTPSACRTDCTIPYCGDGLLDGGEVCDDGNNVGGDGCASDCLSLD